KLQYKWKLTRRTSPSISYIQKIVGYEYFFQLHLDEYNLKYGRENYTVSKILRAEISHKQNDSHKVEVHKDRKEEIEGQAHRQSQYIYRTNLC
ncbi:hypothetical protein CFP56_004705, partial [Quercus suber]